ncbi:MAG: hypothetical protein R3F38_19750 [Gammaproteobacteria bacterium]
MLLDAVKALNGNPLTRDEILRIDAEWRASQSPAPDSGAIPRQQISQTHDPADVQYVQ